MYYNFEESQYIGKQLGWASGGDQGWQRERTIGPSCGPSPAVPLPRGSLALSWLPCRPTIRPLADSQESWVFSASPDPCSTVLLHLLALCPGRPSFTTVSLAPLPDSWLGSASGWSQNTLEEGTLGQYLLPW